MRQATDPRYDRLRLHQPTDEDIEILNTRINTFLSNNKTTAIVVRRHHQLLHAINTQRLHVAAQLAQIPVTYCVAKAVERRDVPLSDVYALRVGTRA